MIESPKNFIEQFQNFIEHIAGVMKTFLTKEVADNYYLGKTAKAVNAGAADKATRDANGNVITSTYATKTEVTSGLSGKLGKTEKASSASTADAVAWSGVSGKPNFATVAFSGSYNDLKNKPNIPTTSINTTVNGAGVTIGLIRKTTHFSHTFTAPSNGIVSVHSISDTPISGWQYLYVNSYAVYAEDNPTTWDTSKYPNLVFPVKQGDVIKADADYSSFEWKGFFIPCW